MAMEQPGIIRHPLMPLLFLAVMPALSSGAGAQTRATQSADATVVILRAASAEQAAPLDFGRVLPSATAGTMTLSPDGEMRCSGGVICDARGNPGRFRVTGSDDLISIDVTERVALIGPTGETVELQPLLSTPQLRLSGGEGELRVGGTLAIAANQPPGRYAGRYVLDLQYQ